MAYFVVKTIFIKKSQSEVVDRDFFVIFARLTREYAREGDDARLEN